MKLPKSGKLYYGLAAGALLVAGGLLYLQKGSLDDLTEQVSQLRQTAEKQKGARANLVLAQKDLIDLQAKLSHLERGVPDAAYVPTMLKELEALGKSQNVEVGGLRPAVKKADMSIMADKKSLDTKPYEPLDLELKGKADYGDLLRFVSALNSFPEIVEVRTVAITPPASNSASPDRRLDVTMGLRAFLFKQPTQAKKEVAST